MIEPCPCGHSGCKNYIAPPLICCACNSLSKEQAMAIDVAQDALIALKAITPKECPIVTHHKPDCGICAALRVIAKVEERSDADTV